MAAGKKDLARLWRICVDLLAAAGWLTLLAILRSPSEAASAVLLGYSAQRLALAALALVPAVLFTFLFFSDKGGRFSRRLQNSTPLLRSALFAALIVACALLFLPADRALTLLGSASLYLVPLSPLLLYASLLSAILLIFVSIAAIGFDRSFLKDSPRLKNSGFIFLGFLVAWSAFKLTGLGLGFDATIWNAPGSPLLVSQVLLSLAASLLLLRLAVFLRARLNLTRLDLGLAVIVWAIASAMWLAQPAEPTYYSSVPSAPNYESYPLSDAFNHDVIANNVLVGEGFHFGSQVAIRRPLYVMLLAGLEALLGPTVAPVVTGQVIVLALFPAILFLLGTRLQNRLAGLLIAGFIIFRETNSIALGHVINASHAKLLMADLPTALAMAGLALAAISWLRQPARRLLPALLTGGLLGAFVLLRSQTLTLIPVLALLALFVWGWRLAWKQIVLFVIGVVLVASPWIIRNRVQMGQWAIEDAVVAGFLANRYRFEPGTFGLPFLPGESEGEYYARQMASVRQFAQQNPGYVAGFVADNFVRNQILNFTALPVSWELRDLESHVRQLPFWPSWDGSFPPESNLPMLVNLFLVSIGLASAWKHNKWVGLVPAFINVGFTANLALARVSGWRYNLPADWTVLFYFALGIAQVVSWTVLAFNKNKTPKTWQLAFEESRPSKNSRITNSWSRVLAAGVVLAVLGSSFLIIEAISHPRYARLSPADAQAMITHAQLVAGDGVSRQQLQQALANENLYWTVGRALHPRFFRPGEGVPESGFDLTTPMDFRRITFFLVGPNPSAVALRVSSPSLDFPNASDVLVLRCDRSQMEAAAVIILDEGGDRLYISPELAVTCPNLN